MNLFQAIQYKITFDHSLIALLGVFKEIKKTSEILGIEFNLSRKEINNYNRWNDNKRLQ